MSKELNELLVELSNAAPDVRFRYARVERELRRAVEATRKLKYFVKHAQRNNERKCWEIPMDALFYLHSPPNETHLQEQIDADPNFDRFDLSGPEVEWAYERACAQLVIRHIDRMHDVCAEDEALRIVDDFRRRHDLIFEQYLKHRDPRMPSWKSPVEDPNEVAAAFLNEGTVRLMIDGGPRSGKTFLATVIGIVLQEIGAEFRFTNDDGTSLIDLHDLDPDYVQEFKNTKPLVTIFERHDKRN